MGTHPIFESDFDCLTEKLYEMSFTNTHVVFTCFAFLCILMGMQYTIYGGEENEFTSEEMIARYEMANSEANEELISEIHILKDAINEINDKINTNQPVLNNHTLAEFLEDPTSVIEDSPSYRSMATYAEEKKVELDNLKKQMGDYELNQCKIEDKIYFLKILICHSTLKHVIWEKDYRSSLYLIFHMFTCDIIGLQSICSCIQITRK